MRMFSVLEREFVVIVPCLEIVLCHSNVSFPVTGSCRDCSFVDNVACKAFTIKRAEILISAIALSFVFNIIATFLQDLLIVVFDYVGRVRCVAVADFKVVSVEYLVKLVRFWKVFVN